MAKRAEVKEIKLDKKSKLAIVRGYLIEHPDFHRYGYNKKLQEYFLKKYGVRTDPSEISRAIKQVKEEWQKEKNVLITKNEIISALQKLYESTKQEFMKLKILQEINKLEGLYIDHIQADIKGDVKYSADDEIVKGLIERVKKYEDKEG